MLKLNVNRTFRVPVPVTWIDESGEERDGEFSATFRIPGRKTLEDTDNQGRLLLDVVLVAVHDLELRDEEGSALCDEDLRLACLADHTLATALTAAYWEHAAKKPRQAT